MMRREGGRVIFDLSLADADRLCLLPRSLRGSLRGLTAHVDGPRVTFEYSQEGLEHLLLHLGMVTGACRAKDGDEFWAWIALANAINEGSAEWTPYQAPWKDAGGASS